MAIPDRKSAPTRAGDSEAQDALEMLIDDHRRVDEMFEDYEALRTDGDDADKETLVVGICVSLTVHATVEEEVFYPAAREVLTEAEEAALLDEAEVEHGMVRELVEQLSAMGPSEALYDAKVRVLAEYVRHHVQEEEERMFPALRDTALDLASLGAEIAQRRQELHDEIEEEIES
jgi:hemerythrin superfamily protein